MPRSPDPRLVAVPGEPVVVVPDAGDHVRTDALLSLVAWLTEARGVPPTVVCWQTGERVDEFARLAPVLDAGAINDALPARVLAAVRLTPVARLWKSRRLRRLLAPIASVDHLVLGGVDTAPLLEWLPARSGRDVALWVGDDEVDRVDRALAAGTAFLASGDRAAAALLARGAAPSRVHPVGEPLVAGPSGHEGAGGKGGAGGTGSLDPPRHVAVVGAGPEDDAAVPGLIAAVLATAALPAPAVAWVRSGPDRPAARWADDRYAGFEDEVTGWTLHHARRHLDDLVAVVVAGPEDRLFVAEAAVRGIPVLADHPVEIRGAVEVPDLDALRTHLTELVADPTAHARLAAAREAARPHLVDQTGPAVLAALGLAG